MRLSGILLQPIPHRAHSLFELFCYTFCYTFLYCHTGVRRLSIWLIAQMLASTQKKPHPP